MNVAWVVRLGGLACPTALGCSTQATDVPFQVLRECSEQPSQSHLVKVHHELSLVAEPALVPGQPDGLPGDPQCKSGP